MKKWSIQITNSVLSYIMHSFLYFVDFLIICLYLEVLFCVLQIKAALVINSIFYTFLFYIYQNIKVNIKS